VFSKLDPTSDPTYPSSDTRDPVDIASGNLSHQNTDVAVPGRGVSLSFTRYYNSGSLASRSLGLGWTHSYDSYLTFSGSDVTVFYPQGHAVKFTFSGGVYTPRAGIYDSLVKNGDNTYTLTNVGAVKFNFSPTGQLTSIVDRNNNTTTVAYDANGRLSAVTDPGGRSLTFTTDSSTGRISQITDPLSRHVGFTYDANGDLTQVTDVKSGTTTYAYSAHRMTSLTDSNNHVAAQNVYDTASRVAEQTDALGGKTCIYYSTAPSYTSTGCPGVTPAPGASQTIVVDQRTKKTTYTYDSSYRTTQVTDHDGNSTSFTYDANHNRTCVTDPMSHKTGYTYDTKGNVTGVIDANNTAASCTLTAGGVQWTYTYTSRNDVDLATDPRGNKTDYVYDVNGNLTEVQRKDSSDAIKLRTCFTVAGSGLVTARTESTTLTSCTGNTTGFDYDTYGNVTAVTDPRFYGLPTPPKTTMTYDLGGRRLTVTDELSHATTFSYDNQNQVLTARDHLNYTTTNTYDAKGNLRTVTDANNKVTTYSYDNGDRLVSVLDADNKTTAYGYDANGNRTAVVSANRQTAGTAESGTACGTSGTGNGVDDDGDGASDDGCPSALYTYDNLNRLATENDALGNTWAYSYDAASRLTSRTDAKSQQTTYSYNNRNDLTSITYPAGTPNVSFQYDGVRNRTQMVDGTGTTSYVYDAANRLTSAIFPGSRTVGYGYSNVGNRASITYPGGSNQVTYSYDAANHLTTVTDWNSNQTIYSYDNAGRLATATLPNGVVSTYTWDNVDRLTGISHIRNGSTLASVGYTLDSVGNRTQRVDGLGTHTYAFDNLYRLTSVTYPGPTTDTYTYDGNGNRLTKNAVSYSYNAADRLATVGGTSYSYDFNGNLTNRGSDTFGWDAEDRLTSATVSGATTTFLYNGDGLRESSTVGGNTTTFTWDMARGAPQILDDGAFRYIYGIGRIAEVSGTNPFYYLPDGLGSVMALADAAGSVVNTYEYDVFGAIRASTGSQPNAFAFTGKQGDGTGLQFLRARYYDPVIGRFIGRDPMAGSPGDSQSLNRYSYGLNNPVRFRDPLGLSATEGGGTIDWVIVEAQIECIRGGRPCPGITQAEAMDQVYGAGTSCEFFDPCGDPVTDAIYAAQFLPIPYLRAARLTAGLRGAVQAHHLVEARHLLRWGYNAQQINQVPAIVLSRSEHTRLTTELQRRLPIGANLSKEEVWAVYQDVYRDHPEWLRAIEGYFR
jgi:RHS repeat-associated protein